MIKKNEFCRYCGKDLKAKTAKKVFCDDKCRIYYSRELKRGTLGMPKVGDTAMNGIVTKRKQHNNSLTVTIDPSKVLNDDERNDIEKQIKDWQNKKRFSYMGAADFDKMKEKAILELRNKLN